MSFHNYDAYIIDTMMEQYCVSPKCCSQKTFLHLGVDVPLNHSKYPESFDLQHKWTPLPPPPCLYVGVQNAHDNLWFMDLSFFDKNTLWNESVELNDE